MGIDTVQCADLLSVAEAAELLKVSRVTIHRWIARGKLQAVHIGKSRFVLRREVMSILAAQDGEDMESRLRNILARRTPGWTFSFVGEPTEHGENIMVAIGPDGERIVFRLEVLERSQPRVEPVWRS